LWLHGKKEIRDRQEIMNFEMETKHMLATYVPVGTQRRTVTAENETKAARGHALFVDKAKVGVRLAQRMNERLEIALRVRHKAERRGRECSIVARQLLVLVLVCCGAHGGACSAVVAARRATRVLMSKRSDEGDEVKRAARAIGARDE
jgi:hypothetical protein